MQQPSCPTIEVVVPWSDRLEQIFQKAERAYPPLPERYRHDQWECYCWDMDAIHSAQDEATKEVFGRIGEVFTEEETAQVYVRFEFASPRDAFLFRLKHG